MQGAIFGRGNPGAEFMRFIRARGLKQWKYELTTFRGAILPEIVGGR